MEGIRRSLECITDVIVRGLCPPHIRLEYRQQIGTSDEFHKYECIATPSENIYAKTFLFAPGTRFEYVILGPARDAAMPAVIVYAHLAAPIANYEGSDPAVLLGPYAKRLSLGSTWPIKITGTTNPEKQKKCMGRIKAALSDLVAGVANRIVTLDPEKTAAEGLVLFAHYATPGARMLLQSKGTEAAAHIRDDIVKEARAQPTLRPYADICRGVLTAPRSALLLTWVARDLRLFEEIFNTRIEHLDRCLDIRDVAAFLSTCPKCIPLFYACTADLAETMGIPCPAESLTPESRALVAHALREWTVIHSDHTTVRVAVEEWQCSADVITPRFEWMHIALLRVALRAPRVFRHLQYGTPVTRCFRATMMSVDRGRHIFDMLSPTTPVPCGNSKRPSRNAGFTRSLLSTSALAQHRPPQCVVVRGLNILNDASRARLRDEMVACNNNSHGAYYVLDEEHAFAGCVVLFHAPALIQTTRLICRLRERGRVGKWKRLGYPVWYSKNTKAPVAVPHTRVVELIRSMPQTDRVSVFIPTLAMADEYEREHLSRWARSNMLSVPTGPPSAWPNRTLLLGESHLRRALTGDRSSDDDDDPIAALLRENGDLSLPTRRQRHVVIVQHAQFLKDCELQLLLADADLEVWLILDLVSGYFAGEGIFDSAVDLSRATLLDRIFPSNVVADSTAHEQPVDDRHDDGPNNVTVPTTNVTVAATILWDALWTPWACHAMDTPQSPAIFQCKWRRMHPFGAPEHENASAAEPTVARDKWQRMSGPLHLMIQTTLYDTCALPTPRSLALHLVHFIHLLRDAYTMRRQWDTSLNGGATKTHPGRPPFTFSLVGTTGLGRSAAPSSAIHYTDPRSLQRDWLYARQDSLFRACDSLMAELGPDALRGIPETRIRNLLQKLATIRGSGNDGSDDADAMQQD